MKEGRLRAKFVSFPQERATLLHRHIFAGPTRSPFVVQWGLPLPYISPWMTLTFGLSLRLWLAEELGRRRTSRAGEKCVCDYL
jgi:hypothetical protein